MCDLIFLGMKERIIESSLKLFFQNGIRAITMDDIARQNGISKRTLYEMFKDKNDLLANCIELFEQQKQEMYEKNFDSNGDIIDIFIYFLQYGAKMFKTINPLFMTDLKKFHFQILNSKIEKQDIEFHTTILKRGVAEGLFRSDINIDIVTKILLAQMQMLGDENLFPSIGYSKIEVFENMLVCYMRGISTDEGIRLINERLDKYRKGELKFEII